MSAIVRTGFSNFKTTNGLLIEPVIVEWYIYSVTHKNLEQFRLMNADELVSFLKFTKRSKRNFPGFPYIFNEQEQKLPVIDTNKRVLLEEILFSPYLMVGGHLLKMDTELPSWVSNVSLIHPGGVDTVKYDLDFPLIGVIQ
jgi:hypothetical protein